jgi:4-amino-4-deoxy-L-arabinose transferase-like glycosyltransferase
MSRRAAALGGLLRRVPSAAWVCAAVACLNAVCWSLITPPFQVPDEPNHVAYVKVLTQTGGLPSARGSFSPEERVALEALDSEAVTGNPEVRAISTRAQQQQLEHDLVASERVPEQASSFAAEAASEPPLYYALEAIPFALGSSGTLLDQIELMRLLSALMAGLTALFAFLFVREALPRVRWAWTVGGLGVALVPLLGFMSGAVNPDAMLYAVTAALFFVLARAFRRGLTRGLALALGAVIAVGLLTKLNFVGILPGALVGLVVLGVRAARTQGRDAYVSLALALGLALSPAAVYVVGHLASGAPGLGVVSNAAADMHGSLTAELSYIWQLYLPRLPGMHDDFAGLLTTRDIWFRGYVGLYGWLDTTFPLWVYRLALVPAAAIALLCARAVLARAPALRARAGELCVYALICAGLMALIGADSYNVFPQFDAEYGQARYLLPLLPLLALILALAARGAGRRWGPLAGTAIVLLFAAHDVLSQLQTLARFYG